MPFPDRRHVINWTSMSMLAAEGSSAEALHKLARRITSDPESTFYAPGVVFIVTVDGETTFRHAAGTDASGNTLDTNAIFPLASASKLALGIAVLRLLEQGHLDLDAPLDRYLPDALAARPGVTVRSLLCHTSGLPLEFPPGQLSYGHELNWSTIARACLRTPLAHAPGTKVQYSNTAYGLLGIIVERVTGLGYAEAIEQLVIDPLCIEAYVGRPAPRAHASITGIDSSFVGTELEPFNSEFSKHLVMPWSSIFATGDALLAMLSVYGGHRPQVVRAETAALARSSQTHGLGGGFGTTDPFIGFNGSKSIVWPACDWGLTVEVRGDKRPHWSPPAASPESFGQLGSSGCLAWCDPARGVSWAILGTRSTDNGWILRYGSAIGAAALAMADEP